MPTIISLTYRPREGMLPEPNKFEDLIKNVSSVIKYYIGCESAGKEKINHYQCWIESSQRTDNFYTSFSTKIKKLVPEDEEHETSIKCKTVKPQDIDYVLGYCIKEQKGFRTNLLKPRIDDAIKAYNLREVVKSKSVKEKTSLGIDQIFRMLVTEHKERKLNHFDSNVFKNFIRVYTNEISYTTKQKLRLETLEFYINIELEEPMISI